MFPQSAMQDYITEMIMETCRETRCICDRWIDNDVYRIYKKFDEENETNKAGEYLNSCHTPVFTAKPPFGDKKEWEFNLRCQGPLIRYEKCNYSNKEAELILEKKFMEYINEN